jgi:hypothetical protein
MMTTTMTIQALAALAMTMTLTTMMTTTTPGLVTTGTTTTTTKTTTTTTTTTTTETTPTTPTTTETTPTTTETTPPATTPSNSRPEAGGGVFGEDQSGGPSSKPEQAVQVTKQVATTDDGGQLPFTGYAVIPVLVLGAGLLITGLVLRRRTRDEPQL